MRSKAVIGWGVCLGIALAAPMRGEDKNPPKPAGPAEVLPAFKVNSHPMDNFGLGLSAIVDPKTKTVLRLFITEVVVGSQADREGVKPGDEIISVNGRKVAEMNSGMGRGSEIFKLFIDRPVGERIALELVTRVSRSVILRATPILPSSQP